MKTATIPPLRVEPELRDAAENVLAPGESLSSFVEASIREAVTRRQARADFLSRALTSRDGARATGDYVPAATVLETLRARLATARPARRKKP